jgi:hypothetical protein
LITAHNLGVCRLLPTLDLGTDRTRVTTTVNVISVLLLYLSPGAGMLLNTFGM